jgi:hypothetical protein
LPDEHLLNPDSKLSSSSQNFDCNDEALKYVAGYLAHKFRLKFPEFGNKTSSLNDLQKLESPWIVALSRGGLCMPSAEFIRQTFELEKLFNKIHGCTFRKSGSVIRSTSDEAVRAVKSLPEEVVRAFIKTRTFIRIKYLNCQLRAPQHSASKRNQNKINHFRN